LWSETKKGKLRRSADPFAAHRPTRLSGEIGEGLGRELVRVFSMQALPGLEGKGVLGGIHNLVGPTDQMHFHTGQFCVPDRQVVESVKIEIPTKLTINASQQVLVETGSYTFGVVISSDKRRFVLDEIRSYQ
jgi:hypothetical protein